MSEDRAAQTSAMIDPALIAPYLPEPGAFTVISAEWCGHCTRLKKMMRAEGIPYREVMIEEDAAAEQLAHLANGGSWLIPTVVTHTGELLVNPGITGIRAAFGR